MQIRERKGRQMRREDLDIGKPKIPYAGYQKRKEREERKIEEGKKGNRTKNYRAREKIGGEERYIEKERRGERKLENEIEKERREERESRRENEIEKEDGERRKKERKKER